jgi:hypothetical protein
MMPTVQVAAVVQAVQAARSEQPAELVEPGHREDLSRNPLIRIVGQHL